MKTITLKLDDCQVKLLNKVKSSSGHAAWHSLKRLSSTLGIVVALSGCAAIQTAGSTQAGRFEFGLIGDLQYNAEQEAKFPNLVEDLNRANLAFVVHDGDFKSGASPCTDELFYRRRNEFETSRHPFIYTPGDNEWTDCHRAGADPLERLEKLRELFFHGDQSLGQRTLTLTRQSNDAKYARYRENARWVYGDVLFATLHLVGSNNNLGRTAAMDAEYAERNAANMAWMKEAFDLAKHNRNRAVMLIMQGNPRFEDTWPPDYLTNLRITVPDPKRPSGYSDFLRALETEVLTFKKPVVLVHGHTHYFRIDKPLISSKSKRVVENFTRVETVGAPDVNWVRVVADPNDPEVFTFRHELVKKNVADHLK